MFHGGLVQFGASPFLRREENEGGGHEGGNRRSKGGASDLENPFSVTEDIRKEGDIKRQYRFTGFISENIIFPCQLHHNRNHVCSVFYERLHTRSGTCHKQAGTQ